MPGHLGNHLFTFAVISDSHVNEEEDRSASPFESNKLANGRLRYVVHDLNQRDVAFTVHLGDMGSVGSLDRLAEVAPVLAIRGAHAVGKDARIARSARVLRTPQLAVGGLFDPSSALPGAFDAGALDVDPMQAGKDLDAIFGLRVRVVAFALTHLPFVGEARLADGSELLFVNPGSPTLPADGPPTVALLDLRGARPHAQIKPL